MCYFIISLKKIEYGVYGGGKEKIGERSQRGRKKCNLDKKYR